MGTRSTTKIYEDGKMVLALYKQYDGYPEAWGKRLKEFLKSKKFVKGFGTDNRNRVFNGIRDFALQLVCRFKEGAGDLYATTEGDSQEYNYVIEFTTGDPEKGEKARIAISCREDDSFREEIQVI
jgi:hypothetical protein